ncbi:MAG: glutamine--fructose-6-phosphate transaminase (isomerizing), partial [Pseudomonadota bacterium]
MCGIIGIVSETGVADRLVDSLRRMEYRGYDSAGICVIEDGQLARRRAEGKLANLLKVLERTPAEGTTGIAHTRWATHGAPTEANAHPHATEEVAIVHNGIIENFKELRAEAAAAGRTFQSETDSEVVAHLLSMRIEAGDSPEDAARAVFPQLRGAFALAITFRQHPDLLIAARLGSPLVLGHGEGEMFLGSDALALAALTQRITYLEEGDWAVVRRESAQVFDVAGNEVERPVQPSGASAAAVEKGNYRHFMQKEIFEQPTVVAQTLSSYLRREDNSVALPQLDFDISGIRRLTIVACGTSFYAGMVAKYWFEQFARVPVDIDVASEFRYREPVLEEGGLALFISQSGETADTLAALRHCKAEGQVIGVVVNVPTSTMAREADLLLPTHAGPEIGVASTKAFTCQLTVLFLLALKAAQDRGTLTPEAAAAHVSELSAVPGLMSQA